MRPIEVAPTQPLSRAQIPRGNETARLTYEQRTRSEAGLVNIRPAACVALQHDTAYPHHLSNETSDPSTVSFPYRHHHFERPPQGSYIDPIQTSGYNKQTLYPAYGNSCLLNTPNCEISAGEDWYPYDSEDGLPQLNSEHAFLAQSQIELYQQSNATVNDPNSFHRC